MSDDLPGPGDIVSCRASGLAELFDCSARWKARNIDKIRGPTYGRSHLGTAVHFGTGYYDNERILEDGQPDTEIAVEKFLEVFHDDENVRWIDIPKKKAEPIGISLTAEYCQEISHQFQWVKVEATCDPIEITMPNGIIFEITGHVDRVRVQDDQYGVAELKTGGRIVNQAGEVAVDHHGIQLACYEILEIIASTIAAKPMTLPALVIGLSTSSSKIEWTEVESPRSLLFGDGESEGYLVAASKIIEHQLYYGNTRSSLCSERYCPAFNSCFYRRGTN